MIDWTERLAEWGRVLREDAAKTGEPPPTEEDVLRMFLFDAISDWLKHSDPNYDWVKVGFALDEWLDGRLP